MKHPKTWLALFLCAALLLSGCGGKQENKSAASSKVFMKLC